MIPTLTRRRFLQLAAVSAPEAMEHTSAGAVPAAPVASAPAPVPVPAPMREVPDLATLLMENSIVRSRATILPMEIKQISIAGRGNDGYEMVPLVPHKMIAFMDASDEIDEFELRPSLATTAAWIEDRAFLFGTGWGMPLGAARSPATVVVSRHRKWRIQHKLGRAVVRKDIENMIERYSFSGGNNPVWFVSLNARDDVESLVSEDGSLYGWPVVLTDLQPQRGYYGDVMLCDWSYYIIGDRGATIESADSMYFDDSRRTWRIVDRIDGKPWMTAPVDGRSPFVVLDGRSWRDSGPAPTEPPQGWLEIMA